MRRLIIATILLVAAVALVTVVYFRLLTTSTQHTNLVMRTIPNDASLIFEFNNDHEFYDIFSGNKLFENIIGQDKMAELAALRKSILGNPFIGKYFSDQNIFVSLHPQKGNTIDFLLTSSVTKEFQGDILEQLAKEPKSGMLINAIEIDGKPAYVVYLKDLKKRFYLADKDDDHSLSASFSMEVITNFIKYDYKKEKQSFVLLPDQQRNNSLANLYVNYQALTPLFEQLFTAKNPDMFRTLRQFSASSAMSLNFRSDALMFNGTSEAQGNKQTYLSLFTDQQPVINHLKEIFPSTAAYFTNFSVSEPVKFESALSAAQSGSDFNQERRKILKKIKTETGISLGKEFSRLLGNEFAIVTTHYHEKIGIIQLKDGSKMLPFLFNISKMNSDNTGQFNYEKLPQILLGEPYILFRKPYFKIIDNYLILTNSLSELLSYNDTYTNRKFLSRTDGYNDFNQLLAERSNVSFFIHFKNASQLFRQDMKPIFYHDFNTANAGWKNFYGASLQLSASDKNYYTDFCMRLSADTTAANSTN